MTSFTWASAASGSWTSPTFWSGATAASGVYPGDGNRDLDSALIAGAGTVTLLAPTFLDLTELDIADPAALVRVNGSLAAEVALHNAGTIAVGAGAFVTAGNVGEPTLGQFTNTGVISIGAGGSFTIFAPGSTAAIGTVQFAGGTLVLANPLDNSGATLTASAWGALDIAGSVTGGTIVNDGGDLRIVNRVPQGDGWPLAASFDHVAFVGPLAPSGPLAIKGGLTLSPLSLGGRNTIDLTGTATVPGTSLPALRGALVALDAMTIDHADVRLGDLQAVTTITLGADVAVTNAGLGFLGGAGGFVSSATITNTGMLAINNFGTFANAGLLINAGGTITDDNGGALVNTGTISLHGGRFVAPVSGGGTLELGNGATAELTVAYGQLGFRFLDASGVLRLDLAGGTNTVLGFVPGDRIELVGQPGSVSYAGGTLSVLNGGVATARFIMPDQPADVHFGAVTDANLDTTITSWLACFAEGTRIATAGGETPVEALRAGDLVRRAGGGLAEVAWLGHRRLDCRCHARPWDVWPVRVRAGAFAPGVPARDLRLSPDHAVWMEDRAPGDAEYRAPGVLVPVRALVNGRTVVQEKAAWITYHHVELARHDLLLAEGLACESYLDTGNRAAFANGGPALALHPDFARAAWAAQGCAPLVLAGPLVAAARRRLLARATETGHALTGDAGLRATVSGLRLRPAIDGRRWRLELPPGTPALRLRSRAWVPGHTRPAESDMRRLGVAIGNLRLDGAAVRLDDARLSSGWHAPEGGWRWTDGDGGIALGGARRIEFDVVMTGTYWRATAARRRHGGS